MTTRFDKIVHDGADQPQGTFQGAQALQMGVFRSKLIELEKFLPGEHPEFYRIASLVGARMNEFLFPSGFNMVCEVVLAEIDTDSASCDYFRNRIPRIAEVVFPQYFAEAVKDFHSQVEGST